MDPRLRTIVDELAARRPNPPGDDDAALQKARLQEQLVSRDLKHAFTEADLATAARALGLDPGDVLEELASWL